MLKKLGLWKFICVVPLGILVFKGVYFFLSHVLIRAAYEGHSFPGLNHIIEGRKVHPVEFYYNVADRNFWKVLLFLLLAGSGLATSAVIFRWLMRRSPDWAAVMFGLVLTLTLLGSVETGLWLAEIGGDRFTSEKPPGYISKNSYGVSVPNPGRFHILSMSVRTGKTVYDVIYDIDEFGRRITPVENSKRRNQFILFMGCSFTYGYGIQNNETVAANVGALTKKYRPYNYAFSGFGPYDILTVLRLHDFHREVKESNGLMIYTFIDDHIKRTIGSLSVLHWKGKGVRYREGPDGELIFAGDYTTGRPLRTFFYRLLGKSRLLKLLKFDLPLRLNKPHFEKTARVIEEIRDGFTKTYPDGKFYVVIFPGSVHSQDMIPLLEKAGIAYLDYSKLYDFGQDRYYVSLKDGDQHPSPLANSIVAEKLVKDLGLQ